MENGYPPGEVHTDTHHVATQTSDSEVMVEVVHENPAAVAMLEEQESTDKLPIETEVSKHGITDRKY